MQQSSTVSDPPAAAGTPLRIQQDAGPKDASSSDDAPSFGIHHGVPFVWESHPGKSKTAAGAGSGADTSPALPPLTPPPRHYCAKDADKHGDKKKKKHKRKKKSYRFKLVVKAMLSVFTPWKVRRPLISPATSSCQRQLVSSLSSSSTFSRLGSSRSSTSASTSSRGDDDGTEGRARGWTRSAVVCFRVRRLPCMLFYCGRHG